MFHSFQNMDDNCDFAAMLKKLDALDAKDYSSKTNSFDLKESSKMSVPTDADLNSNASDFDHSDEDLASLLADDEEDIFTQKPFSSSPSKKKSDSLNTSDPEKSAHSSSGSGILRKDSKIELGRFDEKNISSTSSPNKTLSKSQSKENDDPDSDALNDILSDSTVPSFLKKSSPAKGNLKNASEVISDGNKNSEDVLKSLEKDKKPAPSKSKDSFFDSFFKNLSSPKDSPEKSSAASSLDKKGKEKIINDDDGILKSLKSDEKIPSRKRSDSYFDSFLKNISPKSSPNKTLIGSETRRKSVIETNDDTDEDDDDLLKSLESDEEKSPHKRKNSYLGSFLKTSLSPKNSPKKLLSKNEEKKQTNTKKMELESNEDDIFGKSVSLDAKKNNPSLQKHSTPEKRKPFIKQVSFKGIPDTFPESPVKENALFSPKRHPEMPESEAKIKPTSQPKRSERMGASSKEDTDWLSFFKESPKKTKLPTEQALHENDYVPDDKPLDFKSSANRRRSSSAEWLGLSESDLAKRDTGVVPKGGDYSESGELAKIIRPQSTPESSNKKRLPDDSQTDLSWLANHKTTLNGLNSSTADADEFVSDKDQFGKTISMSGKGATSIQNVSETRNLSHGVTSSGISQNIPKQEKKVQPTPLTIQRSTTDLAPQVVNKVSSDVPVVRRLPASIEDGVALCDPHSSALSLQAVVNNHLLEKDNLIKSSEVMKQMYEERIKAIENLHKNQLESSQESIKLLETRLKSEMDSRLLSTEEKFNLLQTEKKQIEKGFRDKLEECEKQNTNEIERLKELHNQSIALMKKDHEDALLRLKRLKEQEIEAVLSTQTHSKSLQHLTELLEARATELASLQSKVEERNQSTLKEKQALLEAKERDLKNLQSRVERQLEEGDSERTRLQQLVLRLESRLQKYTAEGEEDRWEVQQMKARLSVQQKHLDEEYKLQLQQVEREKEKLRLAQDSLLHEQKTVLVQLAQERQQLMREKMDMESVAKKLKEEEIVFHVKRMKEESFLESQKQFIQQEENRLRFEKSNVKQEAELVERERESLQRERQLLNEEKLKINEFNFKLKRKETEVEMMAMSAAEDKERAQVEHTSAFKIKAEQQSRMQQISQKMQEVMEKEQQILAEKEKLSEERLDLENKTKTILCNKCKLSLGLPVNAPPPVGPIAISAPIANLPISNGVSNHLETYRHDPSLVVWYITAQRDREYLQEELAFLKSIKDSSTNRKRL